MNAVAKFDTILIANRGEIAIRVMRTARSLGYRTVAVYSDADARMPHVAAADLAVHLGPSLASKSYLDIDKIIAAARTSGAQAVHPGYGFLSESAEFAEACEAAGLVFIGPSPDAIRQMGHKATAKRIAIECGVPCIPGYDGEDQSLERLSAEAQAMGYPVMLKATAGGGGKGMRLVREPAELAEAIKGAASEALKSFGSGDLMMEKAVLEPRHVEVQIFGDRHGNVVYLGDRDCTVQRRHQKVLEEAPAPGLSDDLRQRMGQAAMAAARAVAYVGAGTVEFLVDTRGDFFFLEMNTRLQVEHPVTELVTGLDLVEWQLRVASGEVLPLRQDQIRLQGHAIEARLYAEDPAHDFLPQSGEVIAWQPPGGQGVRVDHGLVGGVTISTYYDPMIAKVMGAGGDREEARRRLVRALEDSVVVGVCTNRDFLLECLQAPAFVEAQLDTGFIERLLASRAAVPAPDKRLVAVAAVLLHGRDVRAQHGDLAGWRSHPWDGETIKLRSGAWGGSVRLKADPEGGYQVMQGADSMTVRVLDPDARRVRVDGLDMAVMPLWTAAGLHLAMGGQAAQFREESGADGSAGALRETSARAPMPGAVVEVRVRDSEPVTRGQVLLVLEAMKMEHLIVAPMAGTVKSIHVRAGQQVAARHVMVEIEPQE